MTTLYYGAQWLKCDLHVHTPFDTTKQFGEDIKKAEKAWERGDPKLIKEMAYRFFDTCKTAELDLVAITDHNTIKGYRNYKPFLQQWSEERDHDLVILPGIELTVGGERNLHILILTGGNVPVERFEQFLVAVYEGHERFDEKGKPISCQKSLFEFLRVTRDWFEKSQFPYLLIPAHINRSAGMEAEIRSAFAGTWETELTGTLRERAFAQRMWAGFQVRGDPKGVPGILSLLHAWAAAFHHGTTYDQLPDVEQRRIRDRKHWPLIEASDPNRLADIGKAFTWLKVNVPDIEGIRLALIDPESRLRCLGISKPITDYPRIKRLIIQGMDFIERMEIPLNPCLNTIIGGRGSGKSAVIEFIRHVLDRAHADDFEDDETEIREYVEKFLKNKERRDFGETPGMLLNGYCIEIELEVAGRNYIVSRNESGFEVRTDSNVVDQSTLDVRSLISPRILSQRQVGRIARDPAAQRRELDALLGIDFARNFADKERDILGQISLLQTERNQVIENLKTLPERETERRKVKDQISLLENTTNAELVELYRGYQNEQTWVNELMSELEALATDLDSKAGIIEIQKAHYYGNIIGPSVGWITRIRDLVSQHLEKAQNELQDLANSLRRLNRIIEDEKENVWLPEFQKVELSYLALEQELQDKGIGFHLYRPLLDKLSTLEKEIDGLYRQSSRLRQINHSIHEKHQVLSRLHIERLSARRDLADGLVNQDADVRLEIVPFSDKKAFFEKREEWFGGTRLQERDWESLVNYIFGAKNKEEIPSRLWNLISLLRQDIDATRKKGNPLTITESAICQLLGSGANLTGHFFKALEKGEKMQLDDMEKYIPEDLVIAFVRDSQGNLKPIEQGSIGLKSTAIISLLLSSGDQPLIIDQPEDELDNKYVYDVVVNLLRKRKFSRQIIIATHNANIPVNGDAEMIIALGVEDRLGRIESLGSIDRADVKKSVSEIMEGSTEAFRLRRERYGY